MTDYSYTVASNILEVRHVSVNYDKPVLRDVNFAIPNLVRPGLTQGQIVAILAPSGTGKTQLFNCIAGIKKPNAGEVFLNELNRTTEPGLVGVVGQKYPLFEDLTVLENVMVGAALKHSAKEALDVSLDLINRFGLFDQRNLYPAHISGGQQQRAAIIQQVVESNHLLLMDEPFSGLDVNLKEEVEYLIQALAAADELNTIVLTTHDIAAAVAIADTILLLGRDRDEHDLPIPGARIQETINLIDRGLAWRPNVFELPAFHETETEIRRHFKTL